MLIIIIGFLWFKTTCKKENLDDMLVQSYLNKQRFPKKVILIIESYNDLGSLLTLIRNILNQNMKVDSIILISQSDSNLDKVNLIHDTCILNQMGGLSFLLKEEADDTILIYIFPVGFYAFSEPYFLSEFLKTSKKINGVIKVETNSVKVDIDKVYSSL